MDIELEMELMLPVADLVELQGGGEGNISAVLYSNEMADKLIDLIEREYGVSPLTKYRTRKATYARAAFAYRMRLAGMTQGAIGRIVGKDHSTVCHYLQIMEDAFAYPRQFIELKRLWNKVIETFPL